jgi:hypothetical protein
MRLVSTLSDRLDDMRVRASVPGVDLAAELRERTRLRLMFGPGVYQWLTDSDLERHLTSLARLMFAGWARERLRVVQDAFPAKIIQGDVLETWEDRAYDEARRELVARGESADGAVALQARGMREWRVQIAAGTARRLSETEFTARAGEAATAFIRDQINQTRQLKQRIFEGAPE